MRCMRRHRGGFTLIEVVIVTAMVAVISLAIYSTLSNGLRIWKRVNESLPAEDISIFLEKFSADARTAVVSATIKFSGGKDNCATPALIAAPWLNNAKTIGQAVYTYDAAARRITRRARDFSRLYRDEPGLISGTVDHIRSVEMSYYSYDPEKKQYQWTSEWQKEGFPHAVRITLTTDEPAPQEVTRTVSFTAGG